MPETGQQTSVRSLRRHFEEWARKPASLTDVVLANVAVALIPLLFVALYLRWSQ